MQNVLAICGWKNSGKTTLIEQFLPALARKGLTVAVIKHDTHGIEVDREGKDSDRFFRAGADVLLQGPGEAMFRFHRDTPLNEVLALMTPLYDVVLVEGHKETPLPRIWLNKDPDDNPSKEALLELPMDSRRLELAQPFLFKWIEESHPATPVAGCILIGGKSLRMGTPKHLIQTDGKTWIERIDLCLRAVTQEVVISGNGEIPESMKETTRLVDVPHVQGPMSGILSAMRWNPEVSWLVAACDMPDITRDAFEWLLTLRKPGVWAVMPAVFDRVQPLLAYYDPRSRSVLESAARTGDFSLHALASHDKVLSPPPPPPIQNAWKNVNTINDLHRHRNTVQE